MNSDEDMQDIQYEEQHLEDNDTPEHSDAGGERTPFEKQLRSWPTLTESPTTHDHEQIDKEHTKESEHDRLIWWIRDRARINTSR
jgi:hypothetical protein